MLQTVDNSTFQVKVRETTNPVVVYFTGSFCQSCKNFSPLVEDMAGKYERDILFLKADIDKAENIAAKLNIRTLPSLVLFEGGMLRDVKSGTINKTEFRLWLQESI